MLNLYLEGRGQAEEASRWAAARRHGGQQTVEPVGAVASAGERQCFRERKCFQTQPRHRKSWRAMMAFA